MNNVLGPFSNDISRFAVARPAINRKCLSNQKITVFQPRSKTPIYIGIIKTNVGSPAHLEIFLVYILVSGFSLI
jgi:hypothetical protein